MTSSQSNAEASAISVPRTRTIRHLPWTYYHLALQPASGVTTSSNIDILTARKHLTAALEQSLGLTGVAISVDILKIDGRDVWLRVQSEDELAFSTALSSWTGGSEDIFWMIKAKSQWLGSLVAGDGSDLFKS